MGKFLLFAWLCTASIFSNVNATTHFAKISASLLQEFETNSKPTIIIDCENDNQSEGLEGLDGRVKTEDIDSAIKATVQKLEPVTFFLDQSKAKYTVLWATGQIIVYETTYTLATKLATNENVVRINKDERLALKKQPPGTPTSVKPSGAT